MFLGGLPGDARGGFLGMARLFRWPLCDLWVNA